MRKKTQYIVVNEIYKTIYCGYPQKRAWKIITGSSGGMFLTDKISDELKEIVTNSSWNTNYMIFKSSSGIPAELKKFYLDIDIIDNY